MAAGQWNIQNAAFHLLARLGCPTMRMRSEDFIAEPGAKRSRGDAAFAGLPEAADYRSSGPRRACRGKKPGRILAASTPCRVIRCGSLTGRSRSGGDDRWRAGMPGAQLRAVTALTFPLLAGYGYARPGGARS